LPPSQMWAHLWECCRVGPHAMAACYWLKLEQLENDHNFNVTFIITSSPFINYTFN
jgi:hypothetical protein